jgi:NTE family protein
MITADAITTKKCILTSAEINRKKDVEYLTNIPIGKAVRASMSFPAIFTPCKYEKYCFIDGGTVDNLPVETLKDLGAKQTIALSFKLDKYTGNENLFSTILRACDIFSLRDVKAGQEESDINIEIDIDQAKLLEIKNIKDSIQLGYNEVIKNKEKILGMVEIK